MTGNESTNDNFRLAARNLQNVRVKTPHEFNVPDLLRHDYVFMTRQGLIDLENAIESKEKNYYRNRKVVSESAAERA